MYKVNQDGNIELDTGEILVVGITRERLPNGGGLVFKAKANLLNDESVCSETTYTCDMNILNTYGEDALARGLLRAVLGEPVECPGLMFSPAFLEAVNIRHHIALANASELSAASLL